MKSKITAVIAAAYIASVMSFSAYASSGEGISGAVEDVGDGAGGVIDSIGDGIEDVADGIGSAADDVLDGAGNAVDSITDGEDDDVIVNDAEDTEEPIDDGVADVTDDDDVADVDEDDDASDIPTYGKDDMYEAELDTDKNDIDPNPATGDLSLLTVGAFAGVAAGIAYLTKKSRAED
ncbi:MAG: hypothetical protein IJT87_02800 [Ruminiclostridium sp.]|nr:hypothetical protein [Ruminiclostridium sp.]